MQIEDRSLVVGNPAKVVRKIEDDMIAWKTEGTKLYQQLPEDLRNTLKPCEPLREIPKDRKPQKKDYFIWKDTSKE